MRRLTDTEKAAIKDLRAAGLGYKVIAEKLSLSRETVRSFCTRNGLQAVEPTDAPNSSEEGATEIKQGEDR